MRRTPIMDIKLGQPRRYLIEEIILFFALLICVAVFPFGAGANSEAGSKGTKVDLKGPEIMPMSELRPGMKGICKTVVSGTKIEDFEVEVLAVLEGDAPDSSLILVRLGGDLVKRTGGLAAGMSGSPIYISGKLAGALSYGYEYADHSVALATPIEEMMRLFDLHSPDETRVYTLKTPISINGRRISRIALEGRSGSLGKTSFPDAARIIPVETPVMVQGLSGRSLSMLRQRLGSPGLQFIRSGGAQGFFDQDVQMAPGGSIGVQLMRGDASITAVGTMTYIEGDRFLAFGHPFLSKGDVGFYATSAFVHHIVQGLAMPFKVASPGKIIGAVVQDRLPGISGTLGKGTRSIPISVTVVDEDHLSTRNFSAEMVDDPEIAPDLAAAFALQALDTTLGRIGSGTSRVSLKVEIDGQKQGVERENLYFSDSDISMASLDELPQIVGAICSNEFQEVSIKSISIAARVESKRKTAAISGAKILEKSVRPGETAHIEVSYRPYRMPVRTEVLGVTIPKDTPPGIIYLTVRGGGTPAAYASANGNSQTDAAAQEGPKKEFESLEDLLLSFTKQEKNSDIIVEYLPPGQGDGTPADMTSSEEKSIRENEDTAPIHRTAQDKTPPERKGKEQPGKPRTGQHELTSGGLMRFSFPTEFVIDGAVEVEVTVEDDQGKDSDGNPGEGKGG